MQKFLEFFYHLIWNLFFLETNLAGKPANISSVFFVSWFEDEGGHESNPRFWDRRGFYIQ